MPRKSLGRNPAVNDEDYNSSAIARRQRGKQMSHKSRSSHLRYSFAIIASFLGVYALVALYPAVLPAGSTFAQTQKDAAGMEAVATGCSTASFATALTIPSQAPASVVIADFNNDGKADIASANFGFSNVSVSLGDGVGGFGATQTFNSGFGAVSLVAGDFNSDGKKDLAVADYFNNQVAISMGIGDGSFAVPNRLNVGLGPHQVVVADFNSDGKLDLATANYFGNGISVLLGDGLGGFSQPGGSPVAVGSGPRSLRTVDINADGKLDIAVANTNSDTVSVLLGNGSGAFVPAAGAATSVGHSPYYIEAGDFNVDGKLDLATANSEDPNLTILFGDGTGRMQVAYSVLIGRSILGLLVSDLNLDSKPDLIGVNYDTNSVVVLLNDGTGVLRAANSFGTGNNPRALAIGDFNDDTISDLAVANYNSYTISILIGRGGGNFGGPAIVPVTFNPAFSIAPGDYNRDGQPDLAAGDAGGVAILRGSIGGGFTLAGHFGSGPTAFVTNSDLNSDGKLDLVTADGAGGNTVATMLGNGDGTFGSRRTFAVGTSPMSMAHGDFNNDGKVDLATSNYGSANLSILIGDGTGGFSAAAAFPLGAQTPFVVAGDFNNDGRTDLAAAKKFFDSIAVLLGDGNGGFVAAPGSPFPSAQSPQAIAVNDFNGDGSADLAVANQPSVDPNANRVSILLGNGGGGFSTPTSYSVGANPVSVSVADFNSDGKGDLVTSNKDGNSLSVLLGTGTGNFGQAANFQIGPSPSFVVAADFNSDGRADLAAAVNIGVSTLLNTCPAPAVPLATLSIADAHVTEGDAGTANLLFTVSRSTPSDVTVSVGYNTFGIMATSGVDFQPVFGRLLFAPGITTQTVTVPINADALDEFDETFAVNLKDELNATVSRSQGVGTILDNDPPPDVSIGNAQTVEGNSGTSSSTFTISLSAVSGKPITIQYITADGSATSGSDYIARSDSVTIPAGASSTAVAIQVNGDTVFEADETFVVNLTSADNATITQAQGTGTIINDDAAVQMSAASYSVNEAIASASLTVTRIGNPSIAFTVGYATSDSAGANNCNVLNSGNASSRCDYETTAGTLKFAAGETAKAILIPIVDDVYAEGSESFSITLSNPSGATLVAPASATIEITDNESTTGTNPIDVSSFFVRLHYIDFLNREPDASGLNFWTDQIESCTPKPQCTEIKRINVSAAFFLSIEFQETGYLVYRFYKSSYGNLPGTPVPLRLDEFLPDTQQIGKGVVIGQPGADQLLEANKVAYGLDFVSRLRFIGAYPTTLTPAEFVDALFANGSVIPSATDRNAAINEFGGAGNTADVAARARALRRVAENSTLKQQETNKAFVLMQYFGYLRRNPNDPPEAGLNFDGYNFWLGKLNEFNGNFVNAEMVKAFIVSGEYRQRFGP